MCVFMVMIRIQHVFMKRQSFGNSLLLILGDSLLVCIVLTSSTNLPMTNVTSRHWATGLPIFDRLSADTP